MVFGAPIAVEEYTVANAAENKATKDGTPVLTIAFRQLQAETLMLAMAGVFAGSLALLALAPAEW